MRKRMTPVKRLRVVAVLAVLFAAAGCASAPDPSDPEAVTEFLQLNDPLEPTNRGMFEVNRALDNAVLKPTATAYKAVAPEFVRTRITNILANLRSPVILANDIMQGEFKRAATTFLRFFINTTIGIAGMNDMATAMEIEGHDEDFGQTLAVWGVSEGPFIMLPLFGPSNPRDTVGLVVDFIIDPLRIWASNTERDFVPIARAGVDAVDIRSRNLDVLDDLEKSSLDFYAAIRSLYRQRRADAISNGQGSATTPAPGLGEMQDGPTLEAAEELSRR
jgi:phospholipid-binding lipoprotein MlaA